MITHNDLCPLLASELPFLKAHLQHTTDRKSPYQVLRLLMLCTSEGITLDAQKQAGKCLRLAERIFTDGDGYVRNALELVYLEGLRPMLRSNQTLVQQHAPALSAGLQRKVSRQKKRSDPLRP